MGISDEIVDFDPFDASVGIPHERFSELRETCPVARIPVGWFLTAQVGPKPVVLS